MSVSWPDRAHSAILFGCSARQPSNIANVSGRGRSANDTVSERAITWCRCSTACRPYPIRPVPEVTPLGQPINSSQGLGSCHMTPIPSPGTSAIGSHLFDLAGSVRRNPVRSQARSCTSHSWHSRRKGPPRRPQSVLPATGSPAETATRATLKRWQSASGAEARRRQADAGDVRHGDGSEIGRRGDRKGASAVERTRVATREYVPDGDLIGRQFGDQRLVSVVKSRHRLDSCNVG